VDRITGFFCEIINSEEVCDDHEKVDSRIVYIQDSGEDENYRLYAVNIDGSGFRELTPFEGVQAGIVDPLEDNDIEMLISLNRRDPKVFDVYRINIYKGAMELVAENPGNVSEWLADNDGQLRVAVTTDGVQSSLLYRETEKDPFRTVVTTDFKNTLDPLFFSFDNQRLYVASNIGRDKMAIYLYDVKAAKFLDLIYEHPEPDDVRDGRRPGQRPETSETGVAGVSRRQYQSPAAGGPGRQ